MSSDVVSESVAKILRCGPSGIDEAIMRLGGQIVKVLEPKIRTTISPRYPLPDVSSLTSNIQVQIRAEEAGSVVYSQPNQPICFPGGSPDGIMSVIAGDRYATLTLVRHLEEYYTGQEDRAGWIVVGQTGTWQPTTRTTYWEE